MKTIDILGARTHNLKNISVSIPRDKLVVITGLSGSGKSSLAFDTLYAEGQRRYVESLSAYARQFLSMMEKPEVDHIEGLSPAISIEQKSTSHNPRSTVGTITEIYDYLRLLFARVGIPHCPTHHVSLEAQTVQQIVDNVLTRPDGSKLMILAPVVRERKGEHVQLLEELKSQGFIRVRVNGEVRELEEKIELELRKKHTIEVVIDRVKISEEQKLRLAESIEMAASMANGLVVVADMDANMSDQTFSTQYACTECGYSLSELEPRLFSFNSPIGACATCDGLGVKQFFDPEKIVKHPNHTLAQGAIRSWNKSNIYYFSMLESLAAHYHFDLYQPYEALPKNIQHMLLYGSDGEAIEFTYIGTNNKKQIRKHAFEGIIPNIERRYYETSARYIREELAKYISVQACPSCGGNRLNEAARHVFIEKHSISDITRFSIDKAYQFFNELKLTGKRGEIAQKILKEANERLKFLIDVGLNYLTLQRSAETLSGGEAQRIRLASQIGSGLVGVMYILDEPSIGLHQRDNQRLLDTLKHLRDLGNTVIVIEHDEDAMQQADYILDIGPGAGRHGGEVVAKGVLAEIKANEKSLTGQYLSGKKTIAIPKKRTKPNPEKQLVLLGAKGNNLKSVDVSFPVGLFTCVTGVSGSGKSTLINSTLFPLVARAQGITTCPEPQAHDSISGLEHFDKVIDIDQSPIGRTPRSNPATYTGLFSVIRDLFAETPEARSRGYKPGRFSFNVKGGRCEACQGEGYIKVEMHFLPDIEVPCDVCTGKRYNRETLGIHYKGKNISEVLDMTVEEALEFMSAVPSLNRKLETLVDVGLSYIHLGQSATTLSGGEAQRIKLARELSKRDTGRTLYILDEPTTGLHFHDISLLLEVIMKLRDKGNTVIVIEHNLDVIKTADWIVDLGPEGGDAGGQIIATGTPEQVKANQQSHTGQYLPL